MRILRRSRRPAATLVSLVLLASVSWLIADAPVRGAGPGPVVMVVSSPETLTSGDAAVRDRLEDLGYTVTLVDDDGVSASAAAGAAFVLITSTVSTSAVGATFRDVSEPVWVAKPWLLDNMAMTGTVAHVDYGVVRAAKVNVLEPAHPLAAGMKNTVRVTLDTSNMSFGNPALTATVVTDAAGEPSAFVYRAGARLVDGTEAAGCRLHFPIYKSTPTLFTAAAWALLDAAAGYAAGGCAAESDDPTRYALFVSVDGMRSDVVGSMGPTELPNLHRFVDEGATTFNARSAYHETRTLPNHTSMLTGLAVGGGTGHGVTFNEDDGATVHDVAGRYVPSMFDVAHDHGMRTGLFAGKAKFDFFDRSWNGVNGAPDVTGPKDGRDKIDVYQRGTGDSTTGSFISHMRRTPFDLSLIHYAAPDAAGHDHGWDSPEYRDALRDVDGWVGQILAVIEDEPALTGHATIVLTADHGGTGTSHADPTQALNYTIPFFVWGAGVQSDSDLYTLNVATRADPGTSRPTHDAVPQPIRNADGGNLLLAALGLGPVPSSTINPLQDLSLTAPVVMIVGNAASPTPGDAAVLERWVARGIPVEVVDDDASSAADAPGASFVFISSSVSSGAVGDTFAAAGVPVWVAKPWLLDDMAMAGPVARTDYGVIDSRSLSIITSGHPMAGGFEGTVTLTPSARQMSFGVSGSGGVVIATAGGLPTTFVYPPGATLTDGSEARACRIHASAYQLTPLSWNADAWTLFDAVTDHAATGCA